MRRLHTCAVALAATASLVVAGGSPALATQHVDHSRHFGHGLVWHPGPHKAPHQPSVGSPQVVASNLAGPLTFAVDGSSIYVGQAFAGIVSKLMPGADPLTVGTVMPGADASAVDVAPGVLTWGERSGEEGAATAAILHRQTRDGLANIDLLAYEKTANPDKAAQYGLRGVSSACLAQLPDMFQPYSGVADSHPYGSVNVGTSTYVADAGANAVLRVDGRGHVSTVAVLPPVPLKVTADLAAGAGLPPCAVGGTYYFEPVPTDVEMGAHGMLYVTMLPGGPEDGSLGDLGRLMKVDPRSGHATLLAKGLAGATGVAIGHHGAVYVSELYGNEVSSVDSRGRVRKVVALNQPAGIEWANGKLYVSTDVFGAGQIVKLAVR